MTVAIPEALGGVPVCRDAATLERYEQNVSGLVRSIGGVVFPEETAQVQALVCAAAQAGLSLYPLSTGANWGLGSRLPVRSGDIVVDLGNMRRIFEINERFGYAVIEPGVTQAALAQRLHETGSRYFLNVTGSGAATSVIGNALDRGIAHHGPRADELSGLEVVLGTGELLQLGTGGRSACRTTHLYRPGVGPGLDGLFFQSNLGIVTRAGLRLHRRPEVQTVLRAALRNAAELPSFVDQVADLVQLRVLDAAVHFPNAHRVRSVLGSVLARTQEPQRVEQLLNDARIPSWSLSCPMGGTVRQVEAAFEEAKAALGPLAEVHLQRAAGPPSSTDPLTEASRGSIEHSLGVPSDTAVGSICWPLADTSYAPGRNLDQTRAGTVFVLPVLPMSGECVAEVVALTEQLAAVHGFTPYITFNAASSTSLEAVINFLFLREDASAGGRAHGCAEELTDQLGQRGYILYRAGIQAMGRVVDPASAYWQTAKLLKQVLDPGQILSPGRYSLL